MNESESDAQASLLFFIGAGSILIIAFSRNHKVRAGADVGNAWHIFFVAN